MHKPTLRVIAILEQMRKGDKYTLTELSHSLHIPVSTLFPILQTLKEKRYLQYDPATQRYSHGIRTFEIGSSYIQKSEAYQNMVEILQHISNQCGETSHFGVLDQGDVLYLAKVDSPNPIRMYSAIGKRLPAYSTALGKAILSGLTRAKLEALYPEGLEAITKNTITDMEELWQQLRDIQKTGVALEIEESNEMIRCVAVPVWQDGGVVAALSVPIPLFRFTVNKESEIIALLKEMSTHVGSIVPYMNL